MQIAVDSCKRVFWVDTTSEIRRITQLIDIKKNGYPEFWKIIQDGKRRKSGAKLFGTERINKKLICSMNYLYNIKPNKYRSQEETLPMDYFFQKFELETNRRQSKKVEELIEKYSLMKFTSDLESDEDEDIILLREDYDDLINDIKRVYISSNYIGLMSWLINRAFVIGAGTKRNQFNIESNMNKNRALLLKILYDINPKSLIKCFSKNLKGK